MYAECNVQFHYSPSIAAWTTSASLRIDAELLGCCQNRTSRLDSGVGQLRGDGGAEKSQLRLLLYVCRFHRLQEVSLEEEELCDVGRFKETRTGLASNEDEALPESSTRTCSEENCQCSRRRVRTALREYSWAPCPRPIKHMSWCEYQASQSLQSSSVEAAEQSATAAEAAPLSHDVAETPLAFLSTLFSTIPSSVGPDRSEETEEREHVDGPDRLVLRLGSFPSSDVDESKGSKDEKEKLIILPEMMPQPPFLEKEIAETPSGVDRPLAATAGEEAPSFPSDTSFKSNAAAVDAAPPPPPPQRRLLLLRHGTSNDGVVSSPNTATVAPSLSSLPSPFPPPPLESFSSVPPQRRRVLIINAAVKSPVAAQPAEAKTAPPSQHLKQQSPPCAPKVSASDVKVDLPLTEVEGATNNTDLTSPTLSPPDQEFWTPYVFCFTCSSTSEGTDTGSASAFDEKDATFRPQGLRRRLVAVYLTFSDVTVETDETTQKKYSECTAARSKMDGGVKKNEKAHCTCFKEVFWSRASVASCGWFNVCAASPVSDQRLYQAQDGGGYAFIMADDSFQTSWICPLAAPIFDSTHDVPYCRNTEANERTDLYAESSFIAGPLVDVWVSAVSADAVTPAPKERSSFPSSAQAQQHSIEKKEQLFEEETNGLSRTSHECPTSASASLPCLHFTPMWLSQLSCSFGSKPALRSSTRKEAVTQNQCEAVVQWPSSSTAHMMWTASQISPDCVVLRASFSSASPTVTTPQPQFDSRGPCCICLQGDPHLMENLYTYFQEVQRRWLEIVQGIDCLCSNAPVEEPSANTPESAFQIVLTRIAPASLSLRGGAAGSVSGIVVAEETARAADFSGRPSGNYAARSTTLRARVAVTAAMLQHLFWQSLRLQQIKKRRQRKGQGAMPGGATERCRDSAEGSSEAKLRWFALEGVADMRLVASRFTCVARALALQWVCDSREATRPNADAMQQFLTEERFIFTSASAVGPLLGKVENSGKQGQQVSPGGAAALLQSYQRQYTASSLAALSWLSHSMAPMQWVRNRGVVTASAMADQRKLCGWALSLLFSASDKVLPNGDATRTAFGANAQDQLRCRFTESGSAFMSILKGTVTVRIQHAAAFNALHINLDWRATSSCSPEILAMVAGADGTAPSSVELPFLLMVFVLEEEGSQKGKHTQSEEDMSVKEESTQDVLNAATECGKVRLYQVTPFSWHLPAQSCTAGFSSTAHLSLTVMHAVDLVARRPDAFSDFNIHTVTGFCGDSSSEGWLRRHCDAKATARRRRPRRRKQTDMTVAFNALENATQRRKGSHSRGGDGGGGRTRKRRRVQSDSEEDDTSESVEDSVNSGGTSGFGEAENALQTKEDLTDEDGDAADERESGGEEGGECDDDDDTLFLNLGISRNSRKRRKVTTTTTIAASSVESRRKITGLVSSESLSALDTARVIPLVVFRRDCAAPLLDVQVQQATLLAAQLLAAGYSTTVMSGGEDANEEIEEISSRTSGSPSATTALCSLLCHWAGFATAHAFAAEQVEQLRQRQERLSLLSLAATEMVSGSVEVSPLTDKSVLCAYAELLRDVLLALTASPTESASVAALQNMIAVDKVVADVLSATTVVRSVRNALSEYARLDAACRSLLLTYELEVESDDILVEGDIITNAAVATGRKRNNLRGKLQLQHRRRQRRKLAEERNVNEVDSAWAAEERGAGEVASAFYSCILGSFLRTRHVSLRRLLAIHEETAIDLDRWFQLDRASSTFLDFSRSRLNEAIDVLRRCEINTRPVTETTGDCIAPLPVAPQTINAPSSTLRLQLRASPTPRLNVAFPQAVDNAKTAVRPECPAFTPPAIARPLASEYFLSLSQLQKLCAVHLRAVSPSALKGDILIASAQALMTAAEIPPISSATTAAAVLGLAVAQLTNKDNGTRKAANGAQS